MPVQIACPNPACDSSILVDEENLGQLGQCEKCGTEFDLIPGTRAEVPPSISSISQTDPEPKQADAPPDILKKIIGPPESVDVTPPPVDDSLITNKIGMKLKLIPAGEFFMGAAEGEPDAETDEKPQHKVRITRPFYLGVYEVTQGEYKAMMGTNPSRFPATGEDKARVLGLGTDRYPVEDVSWLDAIAFCNKLSEREGLKPCYTAAGDLIASGTGYRLPTEAEWEYACRGVSEPVPSKKTSSFSIGAMLSPADANFDSKLSYNGSAKGVPDERPRPVGSYRPNGFGLYDMHGNVWEWCQDWYDAGFYEKPPYPALVVDPQNLTEATGRVVRGGSWFSTPLVCRSANRTWRAPGSRVLDERKGLTGFRVARVR
jgi:formylglycine-generating enzyme required for sulfatase activity